MDGRSHYWGVRPGRAQLGRLSHCCLRGASRGLRCAPIAAGWVAVRPTSTLVYPPPGGLAIVAWVIHAIVASTAAATITERGTRRFLPLATLLGMTIAFPDQAPSRCKLALRSGTVHRLQAELADPDHPGLGQDTQQAAEAALQLVTVLGRHERLTRGHTERVRAYADLIAASPPMTTTANSWPGVPCSTTSASSPSRPPS